MLQEIQKNEGKNMPLKKATGNMYSWITHTWNPVRGECPFQCSYCYVKRGGKQNPLHLDEKDLRTNLGASNFVFVCSGCDLFHPDIPRKWIERIISYTSLFFQNKYLWHTKNPGRASEFSYWQFPSDSFLCATVETNRSYTCMGTNFKPLERIAGLSSWLYGRMVTVEPILDFDGGPDGFARLLRIANPYQVNIGADSGHNNLPEPSREKVEELIELLAPHTKIHLKNNLRRILPESRYYGNA
jgi:hypothetical protein